MSAQVPANQRQKKGKGRPIGQKNKPGHNAGRKKSQPAPGSNRTILSFFGTPGEGTSNQSADIDRRTNQDLDEEGKVINRELSLCLIVHSNMDIIPFSYASSFEYRKG